jgi:hypothetical protein
MSRKHRGGGSDQGQVGYRGQDGGAEDRPEDYAAEEAVGLRHVHAGLSMRVSS